MGVTTDFPLTAHTARVLLICRVSSDLHGTVEHMERAGHSVTVVSDPAALENLLTNRAEEFDVAVLDTALPGLSVTRVLASCREGGIQVPFILEATDEDEELPPAADTQRCLRLSHPVDTAALNALLASAAAQAHREREWKSIMARLDREVEERTRNLEAARAQAEKNYRDLQHAQSQLLQSEKLASIGQLAAGVAHEINNPIGFIYSNMNTLREYIADIRDYAKRCCEVHECVLAGDSGKAAELARELREWSADLDVDYLLEDLGALVSETIEGAERVKKIVMDLRTFSRAEKEHKTTADINQGLESTINVCWNELKYHCEVVKDFGDIPEVVCYPMKLNQVFMNLIVNAAQAIEDKGTVTVRTYHENDNIFVQISDTGCGIPQEDLDKIFDPFFTTKPVGKGTGLGLSIGYSIIADHGGQIMVESEVGKGTIFTIRLPVRTSKDV